MFQDTWGNDKEAAEALMASAAAVATCLDWSTVNRNKPQLVVAMMKAAATVLAGLEGTVQDRAKWATGGERKKREESARVKLVTMHSSKGLEFESVYIIGAHDDGKQGEVPEESVAEERRVLYVAMTRAKNKLTITYTAIGGKEPCRFLMGVNPLVRIIDADEVVVASRDKERHRTQALTG
jgi:hypothetical protein